MRLFCVPFSVRNVQNFVNLYKAFIAFDQVVSFALLVLNNTSKEIITDLNPLKPFIYSIIKKLYGMHFLLMIQEHTSKLDKGTLDCAILIDSQTV